MAWKRLPDPYDKYVTPADWQETAAPAWITKLQTPTLDQGTADAIFAQWNSQLGGASGGGGGGGGYGGGTVDYRSLIEGDPYYRQAQADMSAGSVSDAAQRAAMIKKTLIDWGVIPDFAAAGDKLGLSSTALGFLNTDVDARARELAAENEAQGLSVHSRLGKANEDNIRAIRNALAARGVYESGELGYGLTENAQQFKQASTDAEKQVLGNIEELSGRFVASERDRQRALADAMMSAAQRAMMMAGGAGGYGTGGAGGSGSFQYTGGAQGMLSSNGFDLGTLESDVGAYLAQRGWGAYNGPGGVEAPQIMQNGQVFQADGVTPWNGQGTPYVQVKVGTPTGTSTELVPVSPPSGYSAPASSAPAPTSTPAPAPAPAPTSTTPYYMPRPRVFQAE